MKTYKLKNNSLGGFEILKWKPAKEKNDGTMSVSKWINVGYFPDIITTVGNLLNKEIEIRVIDAPLREQLLQLPLRMLKSLL